MAQDCVFCKIVAGDIPTTKVYEDDQVLAFRDLNPEAPVHVLLIPKKHISSLAHAAADDESLLGAIQLAAAKIAVDERLSEGFRVVTNYGDDGGQSVPHLHYHLLGGRKLSWPPG